jgi:hypothetical protein
MAIDLPNGCDVLSPRQKHLVTIIEYRRRHGILTVQQDLAEALGIRRDSLNKLLARTRQVLEQQGIQLIMPPRHCEGRAVAFSLSDFNNT